MSHEATITSAVLPAGSPFPSADQHIPRATPLPPQDPAARPPADNAAGVVVRAAGFVCAAAGALTAVSAKAQPIKLAAGDPVFAGDVIITQSGGHATIAFADGGTLAINGDVSAEIVPAGADKARVAAYGGASDVAADTAGAGAACPDPLLISVKEACRQTGLGRSYMYELMGAGEIAFVHVGKRRLILYAALRRWAQRLPAKHGAAR